MKKNLLLKILVAIVPAVLMTIELKRTSPTATTTGIVFMFLIFTAMWLVFIHIFSTIFIGDNKKKAKDNKQ